MKSRAASAPFTVWMLLFTVVPLAMVVWFAFTDGEGSFTFDNILVIGENLDILGRSILLGGISTVICLLLAYPLAYSISRATERVQQTMVMIIMLPMWMNFLLRTYAWMSILENNGFINQFLRLIGILQEGQSITMINTQGAVVLGMVYNFLPFMVLPLYSVMAKLDNRIIEAAQDLGSNGWQVFRRIVLPLSVPGILSGITMVFVPAVSKVMMIGDKIENMFIGQYQNYNVGASLSLVLMVLILLCMALMSMVDKGDDEMGGMYA